MKKFIRRTKKKSTNERIARSHPASSSHSPALHSLPHLPKGDRSRSRPVEIEPSPSTVHDDFDDLWDNALDEYLARTGVDLSKRDQGLYRRLEGCSSTDSVVQTLEEMALEFGAYRRGSSRSEKIRSVLSSVAHGVLVLIDVGAESAASKSFPGGKAIFVAIAVLIKATQGVTKRFDALLALLKKFGFYLSRLHIRMEVGLGPESRKLTVEILSKVVQAFALATQAMHKDRIQHLVNSLFNKEDEVDLVGQRVDQLIEEDSRMELVEIHRAVSCLSDRMDERLAPLLDIRDELRHVREEVQANIEITQRGFATLSAQLNPRVYTMEYQQSTFVARPEEDTDCVTKGPQLQHPHLGCSALTELENFSKRLQAVEVEQMRSRGGVSHDEGPSILWHFRVSMSSLNTPAAITRVIDELQACWLGLTPEDQSNLKQGIATLYSIAATTVTAGAGDDTVTAWFAIWLNPAAVFAAFLPMAAVYIIAYICWRRMRSLRPPVVPRGPRYSRMDTIMLIDVLGLHVLLPLDRVSTWEDFNTILLQHFAFRDGDEYVWTREYRIADATNQSVIEPTSWMDSVKVGMTLDMSIVVPQESLQCPYCKTPGPQALGEGSRTRCHTCDRHYWATRKASDAQATTVEEDPDPDNTLPPQETMLPPENVPFRKRDTDMFVFRKITVVLPAASNVPPQGIRRGPGCKYNVTTTHYSCGCTHTEEVFVACVSTRCNRHPQHAKIYHPGRRCSPKCAWFRTFVTSTITSADRCADHDDRDNI